MPGRQVDDPAHQQRQGQRGQRGALRPAALLTAAAATGAARLAATARLLGWHTAEATCCAPPLVRWAVRLAAMDVSSEAPARSGRRSPLPAVIDELWDRRAGLSPEDSDARSAVLAAVDAIDAGEVRVAWPDPATGEV
ncbi:MAG TPA: hypothetical protein DEH11_04275, partial [Actinobacteria bacterium]|nr:hypothetical protein [Actinomycetota bacterium]